ncbi:MAG TPA: VanZ family protein [Planctomycetota bacterium]|nr:VanZ family protein [Planctomycetota bacterium]
MDDRSADATAERAPEGAAPDVAADRADAASPAATAPRRALPGTPRLRRVVAAAAALIAMSVLFVWSGRTTFDAEGRLPMPGGPVGNFGHVVAFGAIALAAAAAFDREGRPAGLLSRAGRWGFAVAAAYGLLDEIHQSATPGRISSVYDVFLDAGGAAVALLWPWAAGPGRDARPRRALLLLAAAATLATITGLTTVPGDLLLFDLVRSLR